MNEAEYVVYKGETLICMGTAEEIAERMNWNLRTVYWYTTPQYMRRIAKRKIARNYITVTKLED